MSQPQAPQPAKLVIGFFLKEKDLESELADALIALYGATDVVSPWFDFNFTAYYAREMGEPLFRRMFSFKKLIAQQDLAQIKLQTNQLERSFENSGRRRVNIDPGYLLKERFVLATGKNFSHRIYLDKGIYADLTLIYQKGDFLSLPWTYPDYAHKQIQNYLKQVRERYGDDLKQEKQHD
ncbi:MAG: DUF4416 family protein [Desulfobacteraceae bacterium]|jgi:hypothetical protein